MSWITVQDMSINRSFPWLNTAQRIVSLRLPRSEIDSRWSRWCSLSKLSREDPFDYGSHSEIRGEYSVGSLLRGADNEYKKLWKELSIQGTVSALCSVTPPGSMGMLAS
ncbi:hypothetical protein PGTUg99_036037 [Puccinia graminis f. sp. tritici]|uniref:Uncharacterized protein n=1 Tax=Puccinia graminis f. sp. tritici TaxID=56615 RepID=A0A5B0QVA7_PUCGR|nr:hypothetical protein PGTUg99_036037 [Puccinia graminis f. sp. tritici]